MIYDQSGSGNQPNENEFLVHFGLYIYIYVKTYVSHMLRTHVTILCNLLILYKAHLTCIWVDLGCV